MKMVPSAFLSERLASLGLAQYLPVLAENGFDDWDTVLDITEEDLQTLGFKRGHRRVLQREIAAHRGQAYPSVVPPTFIDVTQSPGFSAYNTGTSTTATSSAEPTPFEKPQPQLPSVTTSSETSQSTKRSKRRYRWHPRPDPHAPKRPKTAYVNFADHTRMDPTVVGLSFVEIAREVGRRWQVMNPAEKHAWEANAAVALQYYENQMEEYRKTDDYRKYQDYLETFKKAPGKSAREKMRSPQPGQPSISSTDPGMSPVLRRSESVCSRDSRRISPDSPRDHDHSVGQRDLSQALSRALGELTQLRQEFKDVRPYDAHELLPRELAAATIRNLHTGLGSLIFIYSDRQAEALLDSIYEQHHGAPDALTLAEFYLALALGGSSPMMPDNVVDKLFVSACGMIENGALRDTTSLGVLRVLLCLCLYALLEEGDGPPRAFIAAALNIAKFRFPQFPNDELGRASQEEWRRVYRSLVFLECWMSYSLNYPCNVHSHIKNVLPQPSTCPTPRPPPPPPAPTDTTLQTHATHTAPPLSDISSATHPSSPPLTPDHLRCFASQLSAWTETLEPPLALPSLLSPPWRPTLTPPQTHAMLLIHILHLTATTLLYRAPLLSDHRHLSAPSSPLHPRFDTHLQPADHAQCRAELDRATSTAAQVLERLNDAPALEPWCFLLIPLAFTLSTSTLLLSTLPGPAHPPIQTPLQTLRLFSTDKTLAARHLNALDPLYALLAPRAPPTPAPPSTKQKISIHDLLQSEPVPQAAPTPPPAGAARDVLNAVLGLVGVRREGVRASDPYPTPP
ncbi:hypothetical protein EJ06DRAFT_582757 [Trichodelitschia bisporula]|uniref:HMG box domain-containing protein n=1 Tax=Trichodelitschia bisporula TaxID=703511 RepID=A0A6G1HTT4_9PEZI|nr:hypothetical protein EJ06DRAFT_582757 [Trichodelitschia bisporula]